jgi:hypothetical protein
VVSGSGEDVLHLREAFGLIPCEREDWHRMFVLHDGLSLSGQVDLCCSRQHKAPNGSVTALDEARAERGQAESSGRSLAILLP